MYTSENGSALELVRAGERCQSDQAYCPETLKSVNTRRVVLFSFHAHVPYASETCSQGTIQICKH